MTAALHIRSVSSISAYWSGVNLAAPDYVCLEEDWFDAQARLGKKGHRYLSSPTKYALAALQQIDEAFEGGVSSGVYFGSSSADTEHRRSISTKLRRDLADLPGAASALSASLTAPASSIAKRYSVHGPVVTLAGGDDTGLICLWSAANAVERGEITSICVGQVEHQPHEKASDGAVVWLASNEACDDTVATLCVDDWRRVDVKSPSAIATALSDVTGSISLISTCDAADLALVQKELARTRPDIDLDVIPTTEIEGLIVGGLRPFSLLSLMILRGFEGRILILSSNGHVFNLTVTQQRKSNA